MKKFIFGALTLLALAPLQGQNLKTIKNDIQTSIDAKKESLTTISDGIWEAAETSLEEFTSSQLLKDYARENGFEVTENVADIPTAFMAKYGSGKPVIGILGEFDANAGISQKRIPKKEARVPGGAGHGCGHNLFGTASLAAAVAIKEQIEKGTLKGTVIFMGLLQRKPFLLKCGWSEQAFLTNWMSVWIGTLETISYREQKLVKP